MLISTNEHGNIIICLRISPIYIHMFIYSYTIVYHGHTYIYIYTYIYYVISMILPQSHSYTMVIHFGPRYLGHSFLIWTKHHHVWQMNNSENNQMVKLRHQSKIYFIQLVN